MRAHTDRDAKARANNRTKQKPRHFQERGAKPKASTRLQEVALPGGAIKISDTAEKLGRLLAATGRFYVRGDLAVALERDAQSQPTLRVVKPAEFASVFEEVARLTKPDRKGNPVPATCVEQQAKLILSAAPFRQALPPIHLVARCPVLVERDEALHEIFGYDRESGILAGGQPVPKLDLSEARRRFDQFLADFQFATPSDRSRAVAALITPALVQGGLLVGRAPVDLGEANASQTGKGVRNKLTAAVYFDTLKTVTQRKGGVGSLEERFDAALVAGRNFISLDNLRGKIDSPALENFMTEDEYLARIPYSAPMSIDPRRTNVMITSNKAEVTPDLANRSSCTRLLKQPEGRSRVFTFRRAHETSSEARATFRVTASRTMSPPRRPGISRWLVVRTGSSERAPPRQTHCSRHRPGDLSARAKRRGREQMPGRNPPRLPPREPGGEVPEL